jgi:hypothetical protein
MMMLGEWPIALELGDAVGVTNDCRSEVDMSLNEISNHHNGSRRYLMYRFNSFMPRFQVILEGSQVADGFRLLACLLGLPVG